MNLGASLVEGGVRFRVWAPASSRVDVVIYGPDAERVQPLEREGEGYFAGVVTAVGTGTRYRFRLDGGDAYPDPASRRQPDGVHGPSEVWDPAAYGWSDRGWSGRPADDLVIYELHVGTFTEEGTFRAALDRLDHVVELGVNAIELMPVANFPGSRNWGYDGVDLFAPATSYGTPDDLKALVDAAHARGVAVLLDVVYNHLGPEGNYLPAVTGGRFFTDRHKTPWGDAVNYDGDDSGPVREFVIQNALYWVNEYHMDGLRLDATHAIVDDSEVHLLQELAARVRDSVARPVSVIAEDERNERRVVLPPADGGYGLDAVWADDIHHQIRRRIAGDREGYSASYGGSVADIVETLRKGWYFEGQTAEHSGEARGTRASDLSPHHFVHCIQNHDQVGNRPFGDRLTETVELEVYRAVSALLLLTPYTPLLWMGQEWGASSPFLYFTDHPEELGRLVTEGRREEFKRFSAFNDPEKRELIPDPQATETFRRSKLRWTEREEGEHAGMLKLYRELLTLRREHQALRSRRRDDFQVVRLGEGALALRREAAGAALLLVVNLEGEIRVDLPSEAATAPPAGEPWSHVVATEETRFGGRGGWGRLETNGVLHLQRPGAVVLEAGSP